MFIKLNQLIGQEIIVQSEDAVSWKRFNSQTNKYEESLQYQEGFSKVHKLTIVHNQETKQLDISSSQMGQMLSAVVRGGRADILGKKFLVRSNGKPGKEVRYFINAVREAQNAPSQPSNVQSVPPEPINVDELSF